MEQTLGGRINTGLDSTESSRYLSEKLVWRLKWEPHPSLCLAVSQPWEAMLYNKDREHYASYIQPGLELDIDVSPAVWFNAVFTYNCDARRYRRQFTIDDYEAHEASAGVEFLFFDRLSICLDNNFEFNNFHRDLNKNDLGAYLLFSKFALKISRVLDLGTDMEYTLESSVETDSLFRYDTLAADMTADSLFSIQINSRRFKVSPFLNIQVFTAVALRLLSYYEIADFDKNQPHYTLFEDDYRLTQAMLELEYNREPFWLTLDIGRVWCHYKTQNSFNSNYADIIVRASQSWQISRKWEVNIMFENNRRKIHGDNPIGVKLSSSRESPVRKG